MGGFEERVRAGFHGQPFMSFLGAELSAVGVGSCEIRLPFQKSLTQQHGFFHGGVIATLADNAGAGAAYSQMAEGEQPLSVEFKINLLAEKTGEALESGKGMDTYTRAHLEECQARLTRALEASYTLD